MSRILPSFVFTFAVWLALTWTLDPLAVGVGLVAAATVALAFRDLAIREATLLLLPQRLFWTLVYLPLLFAYVVAANLDVAWRVLHPRLPIRPGIVRARTRLRSTSARVLLANSITLTPGTLAVDLQDDVLYVHRIRVPDAETERSFARFEAVLRRIFE